MADPHSILKKVFGYDSFRPGQEDIVRRLLDGQDVLAVMPTGAGKSICYQVPALLLPGITIVVSPLVSLMKDQGNALVQSGVRAAYLNSSLTEGQTAKAIANAMEGVYKIIYVAPERLFTPRFQNFAQGMNISMVCVDEPRCVSQWGQDFRPSYLKILEFLKKNSDRTVAVADIDHYLKAQDCEVNITTIYRYLDKLAKDGTVIKYVAEKGNQAVYQYVELGHHCEEHLHLQCVKCGKIIHLECEFMDEISEHILKDHGFKLQCKNSILYGMCSACQESK